MLCHVLFAVAAVIIIILALLVAMALCGKLRKDEDSTEKKAGPPPLGGSDESESGLVTDVKFLLQSRSQKALVGFVNKTCSIEPEEFIRVLEEAKTDKELSEELKKKTKAKQEETKGRSDSRVRDVKQWLDKLKRDIYYLDVGTSEGAITAAVVEYLRLPSARAFGIDIVAPPEGDKSFTSIVYDGINLPWEPEPAEPGAGRGEAESGNAVPGGGFDLVTMFMAAHHFEKPDATIESVKSVMKPGALLIVREHDVEPHDREAEIFLDFVHFVYAVVLNGEMPVEKFSKAYAKGKIANYSPVREWKALFEKHGFHTLDFWRTRDKFFSCYLVLKAAPRVQEAEFGAP